MIDLLIKLKNERNLSNKTLTTVSNLVNTLFCIFVENNLNYYSPNIFCNCFNEVVLEFWGQEERVCKKLIFCINEEVLEYFKFEKSTDQFDVNCFPDEGNLSLEDKQFMLNIAQWISK